MDQTQHVIRESPARRYVGFVLFCLIGALTIVVQGVVPEIGWVRVQWFFLVIAYVGIYKPPGMSVILTTVLGLLLDLYSGARLGEGLFCSFFVMGGARLVSRIIYADKPLVQFSIVLAVLLALFGILSVMTLLEGLWVGGGGSFIVTSLLSALATALFGVPSFFLLKRVDPERGGYYLTRFMREEHEAPLV
jgi:rod shape-determining protein MreD